MQPRLQVMMNAKAARHSDRPYNQICRNRLAKQHLVIKGGGPFGEGVYPGFDVNDKANAHKLGELNTKSFTIVTTSGNLVVMGSLAEVKIRHPHGARYVTEAKHADGRTVYVDTGSDPSDIFGKFNSADCPTYVCVVTVRVNPKGKTEIRFKFTKFTATTSADHGAAQV